jgi:GNAT superfamily N-acetyltransferase
MQILEYDNVNPFSVLELNLLSFRFALTTELAALIRRLDPRPFPFLALYAVDEGNVVGQVGVFRLPMMMTHGPEDVGGIWAMATHPGYSRRGVGSLLIEEAHARMRAAGLRFSVLGTSRHWVAHPFYRRHGYQEIAGFASALNHRDSLLSYENKLQVKQATRENLDETDALFHQIAIGKIGFARRHDPFMSMMVDIGDAMGIDDLRLLWLDDDLVGYAVVRPSETMFKIDDILLRDDTSIMVATAALLRETQASYVQITMNNHSPHLEALRQAGFRVTSSTWDVVMARSLTNEMHTDDLRRFAGIGSNRYLMSWMDVT